MRLPGCATASAIRSPSSPEDHALGERAHLGMAPARVGTGEHSGQGDLTEALVTARPFEGRHGLPRSSRSPDDSHPGHSRRGRRRGSPARGGRHPRWPWRARGRAGRRRWPGHTRPMVQKWTDRKSETRPSRRGSSRAYGEGLGLAQIRRGYAHRRRTARAPCAARAGDRWPARACRASPADAARALSACSKDADGLAVGRPRHSLLPRLPAVCQGLVPHLAPQGMVGQAFDLPRLQPCSPRRAPPGPQQCGRGAPAAAPRAGHRRPPHGSGRA